MAWNRPDKTKTDNSRRLHQTIKKRQLAISSAAIVILAAISFIVISRISLHDDKKPIADKTTEQKTIRKRESIKTDKKTPSDRVDEVQKEISKDTTNTQTQTSDIPADNVIVNDGSHRPPDRYAILPLNCDKQIAGLLYAIPGQTMIGTVDFDDEFEKQFLESLKSTLKANDDSTDEEREIINAVNEAKRIIAETMRAEGKTAGEILRETRQQMREFGKYKQMLREELQLYESDKGKSDLDVSDLFDAANKILKENGIAPFEPNDLTREVVRQYKFDQQENITQ